MLEEAQTGTSPLCQTPHIRISLLRSAEYLATSPEVKVLEFDQEPKGGGQGNNAVVVDFVVAVERQKMRGGGGLGRLALAL